MTAPLPAERAARLLDRLRDELDDRALGYRTPPRPLGASAFSAVYAFSLDHPPAGWEGKLVLRRVDAEPVQAQLEAVLHEGARRVGIPAPRVLLVETDTGLLGAPFVVMGLVPGRPFLGGVAPMTFARDVPKLLRSWPAKLQSVVELLVASDGAAVLDEARRAGVPESSVLSTRLLDHATAVLSDEPGLTDVLAWLRDSAPSAPARPSIVHGDLWPANVLFSGERLTGLIDWTMGGVGDPALDVGFARVGLALMPEPFPPPPPIRQAVHAMGTYLAREVAHRCNDHVGGDERVAYFEALRCAVQLADVVATRRTGLRRGWEHGVPALVAHLRTTTGQRVEVR